MKLRARVALALVAVVVPVAVVIFVLGARARREGLLETTYAAAVARMEAGGRERCEAREEGFRPRRERGRGRGDAEGRGARGRPLRILAAYDASFVGDDEEALPEDVADELRGGALAVPFADDERIALRMPWDDGPCAVVVVEPRAGTGFWRRGTLIHLAVAIGVLVLAVLAATLALGPALRRLGLLASAVRSAGETPLVLPAAVRGEDEIGELGAALEASDRRVHEHLARIEARDRALRDYVDGTTHDLALPLTVLQGHLAAMAEHESRGEPPPAEELGGAIAASQYLAQLSGNLAAAARLDGATPLERREVDLGALVSRVVSRLAPIARHRKVELACSVPDRPVPFDGDELLLERAIANLVHNAVKHRRADGRPGHVAVLCRPGPSIVVLGDGIEVDDETLALLRAGEVPPDPARTRGRGLGLRIVRDVATQHGLRLVFARGEEGGLEVRLER